MNDKAGWWWHTPITPALVRQKQVDPCAFEASLVYTVSELYGDPEWKNKKLKGWGCGSVAWHLPSIYEVGLGFIFH